MKKNKKKENEGEQYSCFMWDHDVKNFKEF